MKKLQLLALTLIIGLSISMYPNTTCCDEEENIPPPPPEETCYGWYMAYSPFIMLPVPVPTYGVVDCN